MRFAWAQLVGMVGDQLEWWGKGIQDWSARVTRECIGADGTESDGEYLEKLFRYVGR